MALTRKHVAICAIVVGFAFGSLTTFAIFRVAVSHLLQKREIDSYLSENIETIRQLEQMRSGLSAAAIETAEQRIDFHALLFAEYLEVQGDARAVRERRKGLECRLAAMRTYRAGVNYEPSADEVAARASRVLAGTLPCREPAV